MKIKMKNIIYQKAQVELLEKNIKEKQWKNLQKPKKYNEDIATSLQAYGDEFINDVHDLLKKLRKFEKKYKKLF